jgi:hypothetical protein
MASNLADFYTGNMAPPLRLPDGSYVPAPSAQQQMTPAQIYEGMYGPSGDSGLTSRSVKTVPIDLATGMPISPQRAIQAQGNGQGIAGIDARVARALSASAVQPNQPSGSINLAKIQDRLPENPYSFAYGTQQQPKPAMADIRTAVQVAEALAGKPRPTYGSYTATPRPAPLLQQRVYEANADGGLYGAKMSPGMAQILNTSPQYASQRANRLVGPATQVAAPRSGGNKTQQALAAVAQAASAPAVAPPTQSTASQESKFQWTDNTYLPSSIANDPRWR